MMWLDIYMDLQASPWKLFPERGFICDYHVHIAQLLYVFRESRHAVAHFSQGQS